jgi:hypothetical protein
VLGDAKVRPRRGGDHGSQERRQEPS